MRCDPVYGARIIQEARRCANTPGRGTGGKPDAPPSLPVASVALSPFLPRALTTEER